MIDIEDFKDEHEAAMNAAKSSGPQPKVFGSAMLRASKRSAAHKPVFGFCAFAMGPVSAEAVLRSYSVCR